MDEAAVRINHFTTRLRQLILRLKSAESDNAGLRGTIEEQKRQIETLEGRLTASETECQRLRVARLLEVADTDVEAARRRVAQLIRSVNKCITLLSEK